MKILKLLTATALVAASCSKMFAQSEPFNAKKALELPFSVSGDMKVRSKYVAFGNGAVLYNRGVIQGSLTITRKQSGIFANIWGSSGFNGNWNSGWDDEIDFTIGINHKVGDFNLTVSETYFDDFQVGEWNDFLEPIP